LCVFLVKIKSLREYIFPGKKKKFKLADMALKCFRCSFSVLFRSYFYLSMDYPLHREEGFLFL